MNTDNLEQDEIDNSDEWYYLEEQEDTEHDIHEYNEDLRDMSGADLEPIEY